MEIDILLIIQNQKQTEIYITGKKSEHSDNLVATLWHFDFLLQHFTMA